MSADSFSNRERGFEARYQLDQEQAFRATARGNRLFGSSIAARLGLSGGAADAYAASVVSSDLRSAGHADVLGKVAADLKAAGLAIEPRELAAEHGRALEEAARQIKAELHAL